MAPAVNRNAPIEAAIPTQIVDTSGLMYCIVSYIAIPAVMDPPGLFTYKEISFSGSSAARNSICAIMELATMSLTSDPKKIMRSFNSLE
ncbi:hypothetical protein D3C76_1604600 [compost metagenome]